MKNKIEENWKAIQDIEQKVRENPGFWLDNSGRHLMIPCMYRGKKGKEFTQSYKEMMVYATFCPFTGKPLYEDSKDEIGEN